MPGQPVKYELLAKIDAEGGWEPILDEIRQGVTMGIIAARFGVSRGFFSTVANSDSSRRLRIEAARKDGATSLLEQALEDSDNVAEARDAIAKAKLKADVRVKLATMFDPERYGARVNQGVTVNIQDLHLDALRSRQSFHISGPVAPAAEGPELLGESVPAAMLPAVEAIVDGE